jgi:hypothetical protein
MRKPDTILDEVHAIRRKIDEETRGMTSAQRVERVNKIGEAAAQKYGFRIVTSASESPAQTAQGK